MKAAPLAPELRAAAPALAVGLGEILLALGAVIARVFLKDPRHVALITPLWSYLSRTVQRFRRVMAHVAAGTLRQPVPRNSAPTGHRAGGVRVPLPRARHWLVTHLRHEGAVHALYLERLLNQPEAAAIMAGCPQAQRLLRPVCHLLGIRPPCLARPAKPRPPRKPAPAPRVAAGEAPAFVPAPSRPLCPRLLTRWPWNWQAVKKPA